MRIRTIAPTLLATGLALGGCGSGGKSSATPGVPAKGAASITIAGYAYHPVAVTVSAGARVTFTNEDGTAHTATSSTGGFDTGTLNMRQSKTLTLSKHGSYSYICQFHPFMRGQITVRG
jgi:plastocyanin